jgi:hypothetical protein
LLGLLGRRGLLAPIQAFYTPEISPMEVSVGSDLFVRADDAPPEGNESALDTSDPDP